MPLSPRNLSLWIGGAALCAATVLPTSAATAGEMIGLVEVAGGFSAPTFVTHAPGFPDYLYIVEQGSGGTARIRVFNEVTEVVTTFLTLTGISTGGERGALGLAFHPDVLDNGYFYVYTSVPAAGGGDHDTWIRRFTMTTPTVADPASAVSVLRFEQDFGNHNGGWIGFDHDGLLWIGTGDGGSGGDPNNRSQNIDSLLGKMLRIDVDGDDFPADPDRNYAIPADNPFVGTAGLDEIWSYGLRNPWRNSFDRLTGDLYMGDVGQGQLEEIDFERSDSPGGTNYGWRVMEGTRCFDNSEADGNPPCFDASFIEPVYEYLHNSSNTGGFSVTGGYVYRGPVPCLHGTYFFADFVNPRIWSLRVDRDTGEMIPGTFQDWTNTFNASIPGNVGNISTFGEDEDGNVYIMDFGGGLYRIEGECSPASVDGESVRNFANLRALPNPARNEVVLSYELEHNSAVEVRVFDINGRLVRELVTHEQTAGSHSVEWDGSDDRGLSVAAGAYLLELRTENGSATERIVLTR